MNLSNVRSTNSIRVLLCCAIVVASIAGYRQIAGAASQARALITGTISETDLVTLAGNTRPEATAPNDRGPVADSLPMEHLWLQLRRSPEREQALDKYLDELTDPKSPNYHHWLTAQEFQERYGVAQEDLAKVTGWLRSHGFTVNLVYPNNVIDFSGTAGQVREAFHTEIHNLEVNGKKHIANMSDPRIPSALAPAVIGVVSLNNFMPRPMNKPRADYTAGSGYYLVVPADLATIYNLNPLFAEHYSGQGQTIVVVEDSDVYNYPRIGTRSVPRLASFLTPAAPSRRSIRPPAPARPPAMAAVAPVPIRASTATTARPPSTWNGPAPRPPTPRSNWPRARIPSRTSAVSSPCKTCSANPAPRPRS